MVSFYLHSNGEIKKFKYKDGILTVDEEGGNEQLYPTDKITNYVSFVNNKGEVVSDYIDYVAGSYFSTKLSKSKQSYEWYPSLATEANRLADGSVRPLPLNVAEDGTKSINTAADRNTLASSYRIYVKTGADAVYNHASDKAELAAFAGRQVALEDYLTPHKQLHNQGFQQIP